MTKSIDLVLSLPKLILAGYQQINHNYFQNILIPLLFDFIDTKMNHWHNGKDYI